MSIEIQFRAAALRRLVARTTGAILRTTCLPPLPGRSVDRLEVLANEATLLQQGAAVLLGVPAEAYLVTDADLFAHANDTPQGALQPAGRLVFRFRLAVVKEQSGTVLRLTPERPEGDGVPPDLVNAIWERLGPAFDALALPLTPLIRALRTALPGEADVVAGDGVVAARFGAQGPAVARLAPGQEWGLFLGGESVTGILRGLVEPRLTGPLSLLKVDASYAVQNGLPAAGLRLGVGIGVDIRLLEAKLEVGVSVGSTFRLLAGPPPALRLAASWDVDVDTGLLVAALGLKGLAVGPLVEHVAERAVAGALDPTTFGATPTGAKSFLLDLPLPPLAFGPAALTYGSLVATQDGMVLGGIVTLPVVADTPFRFEAHRFGLPARIQRCRELAKSGSGAPSLERPTVYTTTVHAQAEVDGAGRFCRIEMRPASAHLRHLVVGAPADGTRAETFRLETRLAYVQALALGVPVSFVLRTPRGVRFVDFGMAPEPRTDEQGALLDVLDLYHPDCLHVMPGRRGRWGIGWHFVPEDFKPRPPEEPGWLAWLQEIGGLDVQLVEIGGLDPGEFVRFRSATHAIEATADAEGRLALPVLLPFRERAAPALLERADGRPLQHALRVSSAAFQPVATLPGRLRGATRASPSGGLHLDLEEAGGLTRHTLGAFGLIGTLATALNPQPLPPGEGDLVALNPQPLPPDERDIVALNPQPLPPIEDGVWPAERLRQAGIRDLDQVFAVPGFADRPVAIARLGDGGTLLLDLAGAKPRIAGVLRGPVGPLATGEGFAVAQEAGRVALFRRADAPVPDLPLPRLAEAETAG